MKYILGGRVRTIRPYAMHRPFAKLKLLLTVREMKEYAKTVAGDQVERAEVHIQNFINKNRINYKTV